MKNWLIASLLFTGTLHAATSGNMLLQGTIAQVLSIVITPVSGVNTKLDLSTNQTNLVVGSIQEVSNASSGYKILLTSANAGTLKHATTKTALNYTARYNGSNVTLSTTAKTIFTQTTGGAFNTTKKFDVSFNGQGATNLTEGTYSDTLTFTIQVN